MPDQLRERDWQTIRIDCNGELDTLTLPLHRRHHKRDPFSFQFLVSLVDIIDIKTNRTSTGDF